MSGGQLEAGDPKRWTRRPFAARALGGFTLIAPLATSLVAAYVLALTFPSATETLDIVARFCLIAAISTMVLIATERLVRRLLPLIALLDLSLVFPDRAPSRFRIAIRNGTTSQLKKRIAELDEATADTEVDMAERLLGLVAALSVHDRLTRGHSERVRAYSQMIATEMGMQEHELDQLRWSALLHDIGKLRIDPAILNKPGKLTPAEFEIVKQHPTIGFAFAAPLAPWLGDSVRAVAEHHERWDGMGYPNGLAGTDISFAARIVSVADAFDVMTSIRSYKPPQSAADARAELARCSSTQFDPAVVRAFLNVSLGRLWVTIGPLSWLAQASLIPRAFAARLSGRSLAMAAAGGLSVTGIVVVPQVPTQRPTVIEAAKPGVTTTSTTLPGTTTETTTNTVASPPDEASAPTSTTVVAAPPTTFTISTALTLPPLEVDLPPLTLPPLAVDLPPLTLPLLEVDLPPLTLPPLEVDLPPLTLLTPLPGISLHR